MPLFFVLNELEGKERPRPLLLVSLYGSSEDTILLTKLAVDPFAYAHTNG